MTKHLILTLIVAGTFTSTAGHGSTTEASQVPPPPASAAAVTRLSISRDGDRVRIDFNGTLQSSEFLDGPWRDVPNAVSPFEERLGVKPRFYRSRGIESIFSSRGVVELTISGLLQAHFDLAFAGLPDGIFPPNREKPYFNATLAMAAFEVPVRLRVRGNSSLQECPFPKLKFKVSRDDRRGTPFFDVREVKIGTHCADGGQGTIGRLREEGAAFREALAYEAVELLGFVSPRVRRARIDYRDTTPSRNTSEAGWRLTRLAFIHEDVEVLAERLGGRALEDEEVAELASAGFDEGLVTELKLLHALLGNWDYALSPDGRGLWNTEVIELGNGQLLPVAGDFDLASWVTEVVRASFPRHYHPELSEIEREARYRVERIRESVKAPVFDVARERFASRRPALEALVNAAQVDEAGRANALRHIIAFYDALRAVSR